MIKLYKKIGETPLEALKRLRRQRPELEDRRLSYAGRLDPMACGIVPILVGEENDNRSQYLGADKSYVFTVLFGVSTDTFDLLGLPTSTPEDADRLQGIFEDKNKEKRDSKKPLSVNEKKFLLTESTLQTTADSLTGKQVMEYPPYSSKTVEFDGYQTPLWQIARAGRLEEINLPKKTVEIYDLHCKGVSRIPTSYLSAYIQHYVGKVNGDFRQQEIVTRWQQLLSKIAVNQLPTATFYISCSAGTYIRRLGQMIGKELGIKTCAFTIVRTNVESNR